MNNIKLITIICLILGITTLLKVTISDELKEISILPLAICFLIILIIFYKIYNGNIENFSNNLAFLSDKKVKQSKSSQSYDNRMLVSKTNKNKLVLDKNIFTYQGHPNHKLKNKLKDGPYIDYNAGPVDGMIDNKDKNRMFMLGLNEFKPECCPSTYFNSQGCACMTKEQQDFISSRGKLRKAK